MYVCLSCSSRAQTFLKNSPKELGFDFFRGYFSIKYGEILQFLNFTCFICLVSATFKALYCLTITCAHFFKVFICLEVEWARAYSNYMSYIVVNS